MKTTPTAHHQELASLGFSEELLENFALTDQEFATLAAEGIKLSMAEFHVDRSDRPAHADALMHAMSKARASIAGPTAPEGVFERELAKSFSSGPHLAEMGRLRARLEGISIAHQATESEHLASIESLLRGDSRTVVDLRAVKISLIDESSAIELGVLADLPKKNRATLWDDQISAQGMAIDIALAEGDPALKELRTTLDKIRAGKKIAEGLNFDIKIEADARGSLGGPDLDFAADERIIGAFYIEDDHASEELRGILEKAGLKKPPENDIIYDHDLKLSAETLLPRLAESVNMGIFETQSIPEESLVQLPPLTAEVKDGAFLLSHRRGEDGESLYRLLGRVKAVEVL